MPSIAARLHRGLFNLKFAGRNARWPVAAPASWPGGGVVVSGFFNEALGIGRAARLTADALGAQGFEVRREDLRPFDRGLLTRAPAPFPLARGASVWLIHANAPETRIALFSHAVADWAPLHRIGYWAWESDLAPRDWLPVSRWLHEIWVPSPFCRDAFARAFSEAGLTSEIAKLRVMPHPVPVPPEASLYTPGSVTAYLTVLTMFDPRSGFARKNPAGAIDAWCRAFPEPNAAACLIVKSLAEAPLHPDYDRLKALAAGRRDIRFQAETLSPEGQTALLHQSDIFLSLHRAEGFGLPLAEAMAEGIVVIATGWSGNMAFMTNENAVCVPFSFAPAAADYNGPKAHWAEPEITAAASALRELVMNPARRKALGQRARSDIAALRIPWQMLSP